MLSKSEYDRLAAERRRVISENRSRRMRRNKLPPLPVPTLPPQPMRVQLSEADGTYIGTWDYGVDEATARQEAAELGYQDCKLELVP